MAHRLAPNCVLLVGEGQGREAYSRNVGLVIQRAVRICGIPLAIIDGKLNILETKGLAAGFSVRRVEVFRRAKQPVEGDDDEVLTVAVEAAPSGVIDIEDFKHFSEDGDVDWVGSGARVIFLFEGLEEISE